MVGTPEVLDLDGRKYHFSAGQSHFLGIFKYKQTQMSCDIIFYKVLNFLGFFFRYATKSFEIVKKDNAVG